MSYVFQRLANKSEAVVSDRLLWAERADAIYEGCHRKQRRIIDAVKAKRKYVSVRCPRRAGKSFGLAALALWAGEKFPGSRVLIISLTLKSTIDNYWAAAPGGLFFQNEKYGLNLKWNNSRYSWVHENGSRGHLAGAETIADIERIRGALAEADIAIVDECKSFAPDLLLQLIRDVLLPGLLTRNGVLVLGGTPGSIPVGKFYEATSPASRTEFVCERCKKPHPTCLPWGDESEELYGCLSEEAREGLWALVSWQLKDNEASPHAWQRALTEKANAQWPDDYPVWRREYLGEWVTDATDLVYSWASFKHKEDWVTWHPARTKQNPAGLPLDLGPWRFVLGIDLGYVDDSALVLCAYSETHRQLRHVYDFKAPGMTVDQFIDEVFAVIERFGRPDAIVADTAGGGSKMLIETLNQRYGLGIEGAKKTEKTDHIELVNSDFALGAIKIIPGSDLAHELAGLQWDLSRESKMVLARTGRLREDPMCPNHLCDALLYLYRYSYHFWSITPEKPLVSGSEDWWKSMENAALARAIERRRGNGRDPHGLKRWEKTGRYR
jgi:hypothetical protein